MADISEALLTDLDRFMSDVAQYLPRMTAIRREAEMLAPLVRAALLASASAPAETPPRVVTRREVLSSTKPWKPDAPPAPPDASGLTAELRSLLLKARAMLRDCDPGGTVDCDDEHGGFGQARRSEWCGGPCVLREQIGDALASRLEGKAGGFVKCPRCRNTGRLCTCGFAPHSAWWPEHPPLDETHRGPPCPDCADRRASIAAPAPERTG